MIACLTPDCGRVGISRGLCLRCYREVRYKIRDGVLQEDVLVASGKLLPAKGKVIPWYKKFYERK